jgi:hypothetical protein
MGCHAMPVPLLKSSGAVRSRPACAPRRGRFAGRERAAVVVPLPLPTLGDGRGRVSGTRLPFAPGIACYLHFPSPTLAAPYRPRSGGVDGRAASVCAPTTSPATVSPPAGGRDRTGRAPWINALWIIAPYRHITLEEIRHGVSPSLYPVTPRCWRARPHLDHSRVTPAQRAGSAIASGRRAEMLVLGHLVPLRAPLPPALHALARAWPPAYRRHAAYAEGALLVADGAGRGEPDSAVRTGEEATSP